MLILLVPVVAGFWYFGYNVGAVTILVTDDAIADFDTLTLTFSEVAVHSSGALTLTPWVTIALQRTTVDLTELANNFTALVGLDKVPAGKYTQVRILVTSAVGVLKTGEEVSVVVPSGELVTQNPFNLTAGGSVSITMRIQVNPAGQQYHLQPFLGRMEEG